MSVMYAHEIAFACLFSCVEIMSHQEIQEYLKQSQPMSIPSINVNEILSAISQTTSSKSFPFTI